MPSEITIQSKQKKCQIHCQQHQFQVLPINSSKPGMKCEIKIDFCPISNEHGLQNIVPTLNNDGVSYLPGFILEYERHDIQNHLVKHREEHDRKIQEYTAKKTVMLIPKPGKKHRYCGVCKKQYEEYLDHIQSQSHITCFKSNRYVGHIKNIIRDSYGDKNISQDKKKAILSSQESSTQQKNPIIIDDDKPEPKKRVCTRNIQPNVPLLTKDKKDKKQDKKQDQILLGQMPMNHFKLPFQGAYQYPSPTLSEIQQFMIQPPFMMPYLMPQFNLNPMVTLNPMHFLNTMLNQGLISTPMKSTIPFM